MEDLFCIRRIVIFEYSVMFFIMFPFNYDVDVTFTIIIIVMV